ncbi:Rho-type gtpase-activating protein [Taxawa tesnikishii (nom. ined.)]|nr:Rho-type gtpase-activating protein [Dothideales sp. JES 119]
MSVTVESPGAFPESPIDDGDAILEEGKAFELAGNRWHIDCFRCGSCGTLLDSDANLLLLGDGSLICNNCTYSCSACGNKIEDLAILTGDQAFCAACFRCRNCKRKIENLRYARTSQGIFCMNCHESLMARRRKKTRPKPGAAGNGTAPVILDKSLPALPPNAVPGSALTADADTPGSDSYIETPPERSPRPRQVKRKEVAIDIKRDVSPLSDDEKKGRLHQHSHTVAGADPNAGGLTLPASTYRQERMSSVSSMSQGELDDDDRGFLPMTFDPNPAPGPPPLSARRLQAMQEVVTPRVTEQNPPRDYFTGRTPSGTHREFLREERPSSSRSASAERDGLSTKATSSHIADMQKGRQPAKKRDISGGNTPASGSALTSPAMGATTEKQERPKPTHLSSASFTLAPSENFKLQEAPKSRKTSRGSGRDGRSPTFDSPLHVLQQTQLLEPQSPKSISPVSVDTPGSGINPFDDPKLGDATAGSQAGKMFDRPVRGDSLATSAQKNTPANRDDYTMKTPDNVTPTMPSSAKHDRQSSTSSVPSFVDAPTHQLRDSNRSIPPKQPIESPLRNSVEVPGLPPRASSRPIAPSKPVANAEFITPRQPPPPPPTERHQRNESTASIQSEGQSSLVQFSPTMRSSLPKHTGGGEFSMEEEMARIMRGETNKRESDSQPSVLRRVSNAVSKHGRSFSDRGLSSRDSQKSPLTAPMEISAPMNFSSQISSPTMTDDVASLRSQLRRAQQRIAELEAEKLTVENQFNSSADVKQANTELREKRSTMAFLDTQREMVVKELEIMTEHLARAKNSNEPFDINSLKSGVLQDFANAMQRLKDNLGGQIEDLIHKRNELTDEISNLIQVKDKGLQEFETLSTKNMQLQELNAKITNNIQDVYQANRGKNSFDSRSPMANGLGIYTSNGKSDFSNSDLRSLLTAHQTQDSASSIQGLLPDDAESAHVLTAPKVVDIRKGQPKKFNWKKGGQAVKKNVTKGLKGAFAGGGDRGPVNMQSGQYTIDGMPYSQMQAGPGAIMGDQPVTKIGDKGAGFGFFAEEWQPQAGNGTNLLIAEPPSVLFGSELAARCDYEKRVIPAIVTRCIDEVEARGMDVEGVYRKSGGTGQVKQIQAGFEKEGSAYDISDPDLDIHAVTSCLKQYFRRLPTPLIAYDTYDAFLEAGQITDAEKQAQAMKAAIQTLPASHKDVLEYLIGHLVKVMDQQSENLMSSMNLSVVFAPTIMRPLSIEREMTDMSTQRVAIEALLTHAHEVFELE